MPLIRYPLDPTGLNPDNRVVGEVKTLANTQVKAVVPTYGPIYTDGLVVIDTVTNAPLVKNVDYSCVQMLQEATLRFGKEICEVILIKKPDVSSTIRINYQVLGGLFQHNAEGVESLYQTLINDNRPIPWDSVLNKPFEYPTALHRHMLEDVVGFEPVIVALERIRNAITLSDVPAFQALIDWVLANRYEAVTEIEIRNSIPVDKVVTFDKLLFALDQLNFNGVTWTYSKTVMSNNDNLSISVSCTNIPDGTNLFWTVEHIDTSASDFNMLSGPLTITAGRASFNISLQQGYEGEPGEKFKILLRKQSVSGSILAKSATISIRPYVETDEIAAMMACCLVSPDISITPETMFIIGQNEWAN
jgi:hypothetical protein